MKTTPWHGDLLSRLKWPETVTVSYLLKIFFATCATLVMLEFAIHKLEIGKGVHVYNLHNQLDDFFKFHEPCYPPFQKERFDFLRQALGDFKQVADSLDFRYWLDFGTMLGATRSGSFIPWDHDMDLGVLRDEFEPKMDRIRTLLRQRGLDIVRQPTGCKFLVTKNNSKPSLSALEYRFDLFMYTTATQHQGAVFYEMNRKARRTELVLGTRARSQRNGAELITRCGLRDWYRYTIPRKYVDDMVAVEFEGRRVTIPRQAREMLSTYRYPYSYWFVLPYKFNCYLTLKYAWVPLLFFLVFVVPCCYCVCCRRSKDSVGAPACVG